MDENLFSFVVLTFNSEKYIEKCLSNIDISLQDLKARAEVFVVDNGSSDGTREILKWFKFSEFVSFQLILLDNNTGTTISRNIALKKTTGHYIVVLDSDAYVNPLALSGLREYLEIHNDCGLAVPKLVYPDGRYQMSVDQFPTIFHKIRRFFFLRDIEARSEILGITDVNYAISAFWMMPLKIIKDVGLLDERIFYSPEDVDYCIRVWKAGYKITYLPQYQVIHDAQEISRLKGWGLVNFFTFSHIKGLLYLYFKHRFLFSGKKFAQ